MKRVKLNPCRACGYDRLRMTDSVYLGLDHGYLIQCPRCRAKSSIGSSVRDAVDQWNRGNSMVETEETA